MDKYTKRRYKLRKELYWSITRFIYFPLSVLSRVGRKTLNLHQFFTHYWVCVDRRKDWKSKQESRWCADERLLIRIITIKWKYKSFHLHRQRGWVDELNVKVQNIGLYWYTKISIRDDDEQKFTSVSFDLKMILLLSGLSQRKPSFLRIILLGRDIYSHFRKKYKMLIVGL